jgi:hypothetical protein
MSGALPEMPSDSEDEPLSKRAKELAKTTKNTITEADSASEDSAQIEEKLAKARDEASDTQASSERQSSPSQKSDDGPTPEYVPFSESEEEKKPAERSEKPQTESPSKRVNLDKVKSDWEKNNKELDKEKVQEAINTLQLEEIIRESQAPIEPEREPTEAPQTAVRLRATCRNGNGTHDCEGPETLVGAYCPVCSEPWLKKEKASMMPSRTRSAGGKNENVRVS